MLDNAATIDMRNVPPTVAEVYILSILTSIEARGRGNQAGRKQFVHPITMLVPSFDRNYVMWPSYLDKLNMHYDDEQQSQHAQTKSRAEVAKAAAKAAAEERLKLTVMTEDDDEALVDSFSDNTMFGKQCCCLMSIGYQMSCHCKGCRIMSAPIGYSKAGCDCRLTAFRCIKHAVCRAMDTLLGNLGFDITALHLSPFLCMLQVPHHPARLAPPAGSRVSHQMSQTQSSSEGTSTTQQAASQVWPYLPHCVGRRCMHWWMQLGV